MLRSAYAEMADRELAERAVSRDEMATQEICARYRSVLVRAARAWLPAVGEHEDVVQDVLALELTRLLGRWRHQCTLQTLLLTVVRRRCIDRVRRLQRSSGEPGDSQPSAAADVANEAVNRVRLHECLDRLGHRERLVLLLHHGQGLDYSEIGRVVRARVGTVASLLSRGRRKLRLCLLE